MRDTLKMLMSHQKLTMKEKTKEIDRDKERKKVEKKEQRNESE